MAREAIRDKNFAIIGYLETTPSTGPVRLMENREILKREFPIRP